MRQHGRFSSPTRRAVLSTVGTAMLAGCSDVLAPSSSSPPVDCSPNAPTWPMAGYDGSHTSRLPSRDLPPATANSRRFSRTGARADGGSADAPPAIGDGVAYVAGDVRIEARKIETGTRLWETDPDDGITTSPAVACGTVYVSTVNETLALDRSDGSVLWRRDEGTHSSFSSPVVVDDTIYIAGSGVTALDATTGTERWQARTTHKAHGVAVSDRVYVGSGSNDNGAVTAFTNNGNEWWHTGDLEPIYATPVVANDTVYVVSKWGTMTALSVTDGTIQWEATVESGIYDPPAIADEYVVVGAGNGSRTIARDVATGDRLWTFETGNSSGGPVITGDRVLVTGANTGIHALDAVTGDRVRHWPDLPVGSQPVVADERLFYQAWSVSDVFVID